MAQRIHIEPYPGCNAAALLGGLLGVGLSLEELCATLAHLPFPNWRIVADEVHGVSVAGTQVTITAQDPARSWLLGEAQAILHDSRLALTVRERCLAVLTRLATPTAGAALRASDPVGTLPTIIACVGVVVGLDLLSVTDISVAPPPWGAPDDPTLAEAQALLLTLALVRPPALRLQQIGYGFGRPTTPAARVWLGEPDSSATPSWADTREGISSPPATTLLLLLDHASEASAAYERLAALSAAWIGGPARLCAFAGTTTGAGVPALTTAIKECVASGIHAIVVQRLGLLADPALDNAVRGVLRWAQGRWPDQQIVPATPLLTGGQVAARLAERAATLGADSPVPTTETALVLIAPGSNEPEVNADAYRIARLTWEGRDWGWVEVAFADQTSPTVAAAIERCQRLGAQQIIALPLVPLDGPCSDRSAAQVAAARAAHPDRPVLLARPVGSPEGFAVIAWERHREALGLSVKAENHGHSHGPLGATPEARRPILPPRYRGNATVSSAPMGAAPLVYDADGAVAWGEIWEGFCELAIAGGPPHRGTLLEPPTREEVQAQPAAYASVLDELLRGLRLITGWPVKREAAPGWIGLLCPDEEAAVWLLRAILTENVAARREEAILFLPAGPAFRIDIEIKNVITAVAKTHHYWLEHAAADATGQAPGGPPVDPAPATNPPEPPVVNTDHGRLPRYDYECAACQTRFDLARSPAVAGTPAPCPFCGAPARRVFTSPKLLFKADPRDTQRVWHGHGAYGHAHAPGKGFHGRGGGGQS